MEAVINTLLEKIFGNAHKIALLDVRLRQAENRLDKLYQVAFNDDNIFIGSESSDSYEKLLAWVKNKASNATAVEMPSGDDEKKSREIFLANFKDEE